MCDFPFERFISNSAPTVDLNANFHLTLKQEILKVKVKDKDCNAYHGVNKCEI